DVARLPDDVGHEGCIIARARADLQDAVARFQLELFQHERHDGGLRGGADRGAIETLGGNRLVAVDQVQRRARQEQVAWDGAKRGLNERRVDAPGCLQSINQGLMEPWSIVPALHWRRRPHVPRLSCGLAVPESGSRRCHFSSALPGIAFPPTWTSSLDPRFEREECW